MSTRKAIKSLLHKNFQSTLSATRPPRLINLGQPLHENRPLLVKAGDITPGISAQEYYQRRLKLLEKLPAKSCVVIPGSQVKYASGPVFYPFQQNNDLLYLTGWNEPDSVMILEKVNENAHDSVLHMLVPPKDKAKEQWEGHRTGVENVKEFFNADESGDIASLASYLNKLFSRNTNIFYDFEKKPNAFATMFTSSSTSSNENTVTIESIAKHHNKNIRGVKSLIADLRLIKSPSEIAIMRRAGQISGRAYNMAYAERIANERSLYAFLEYKFISGGCDKSAYVPVVATGSNALCIHYTSNNDVMYNDEIVLVDAAGSLGGYCSDISRSWPVSGKFSQPQRDLYEAVLNVQRKCIELCKTENELSLHDIHTWSSRYMIEELKHIGIHNADNYINVLYPHYIGHNLGLDVHDVPECSRFAKLLENQVITIEPGAYVPNDARFPEWFHNIGIRIEDDIAVGKNDYLNLTVEAAKEVVDIENIVKNGVTTKIPQDVISPLNI
ncbi:hypothetical protein ACO0QE_004382 [Hanseniaspora vineae]